MELSEEWKAYFPVNKSWNPPCSDDQIGPLLFNPKPQTNPKTLFSSPSIFPPLLPPPPRLSFSRFLSSSAVPYSTSSSIASRVAPDSAHHSSLLSRNRLHLLHCRYRNTALVFFTTGSNHDRIGFFGLHVEDNEFRFMGDKKGDIFITNDHFNHKILSIVVNQVDDDDDDDDDDDCVVGYLMAVTLYAVHWYSVKFNETPVLEYLGSKTFRSSSIACACFSPHIRDECMVLLENGVLFLFDLEKSSRNLKGSRFIWGGSSSGSGSDEKCEWLGMDFSWHPRVLVVARSDCAFKLDFRGDKCIETCLAKIEMLSPFDVVDENQFVAFSRAGTDGYQFVLASRRLLLLCDVRDPLKPLLCWSHELDNPCFIDVIRLSELRSQSRDDRYQWATESGFCIILGSFWNCEFRLFCYGPSLGNEGSVAMGITRFSAWDLPSYFSLSNKECRCGSCLLREELLKDALPDWIDWQQKKDIVLGFGILSRELSKLVCESDEFGGFTLIRLMSSGKIEAQRYCASWDLVQNLDVSHREPLLNLEDSLLYSVGDDEYEFRKKYKYLNLDYLRGYLNDNLAEVLDSKMKKSLDNPLQKESFNQDFHEILCGKLKMCGFGRFRSSPALAVVFNDISLPTSICEVASRKMWATLPLELLLLAFSGYPELLDVPFDEQTRPLEFSVVPDLPQLPPFLLRKPNSRSSKWSHKVQPGDSLVGPVLPLPVLLTLHELRNGCPDSEKMSDFSSDAELDLMCDEVMRVAAEKAVSDSTLLNNDHIVSLADDRDDTWANAQSPKPFFLYHPVGGDSSSTDPPQGNQDDKFTTMITKVHKETNPNDTTDTVGLELFDDLCPIELKFDAPTTNFSSQESEAFKTLKKQFSRWQERYKPYQELCKQNNIDFRKNP